MEGLVEIDFDGGVALCVVAIALLHRVEWERSVAWARSADLLLLAALSMDDESDACFVWVGCLLVLAAERKVVRRGSER